MSNAVLSVSVESTGALPAHILFKESIALLREKCRTVEASLDASAAVAAGEGEGEEAEGVEEASGAADVEMGEASRT